MKTKKYYVEFAECTAGVQRKEVIVSAKTQRGAIKEASELLTANYDNALQGFVVRSVTLV